MGKRKPKGLLTKKVEFRDVAPVRRDDRKVTLFEPEFLPRGVTYSEKYQCYRAYLHIGQKQVAHGLYDTKNEAIAARKQFEMQHHNERGPSVVMSEIAGKPGYQGKTHLAPKTQERRAAVDRLRWMLRDAAMVIEQGKTERRTIIMGSHRRMLGRLLGGVMAQLEYLTNTGEVLLADMQPAMRDEARRLLGGLD
jgi:hypothetical protein